MNKLLIVFTALYFFSLQYVTAQKISYSEDVTWDIIRERLFGGNNPKAFRFEEDIRIQLKGSPNHEDSTIFQKLIEELDILTETVNVQLVDNNANFIISILPANDGLGLRNDLHRDYDNYIIKGAEIDFNLRYLNSYAEKRRDYYYYTIRSLTNLYKPKDHILGYGGIFYYQNKPQYVAFNKVDKDIIRMLYSHDFYKKLKTNTVENYGYLYYWNLRFNKTLNFIITFLGIFLSILGFYLIQTSKIYTKRSDTLKDYLKIGYTVLFWIAVVYLFFILPKLIEHKTTNYLEIFGNMLFSLVLLGLIGIPFLFYSERFFIKKKWSFAKKQTIVFITTIASVYLAVIIIAGLFLILETLNLAKGNIASLFGFNFTIITILLATLRVFFNFLNHRLQSMINEKDVELARMKELKNQAELNALHSRINPHFLYNSLNSIAGLAHIDADKTEKMATSLSSLFRYSINKEDKTYATVNDEIEMAQKYLEVEKVRFGKKLDYTIETEKEAEEKHIPKFIIQPLVENAIKHGLSKITGVGKLKIEISKETNNLVIRIFDNGPDFPDEPVKGYGLQNLHDKLQILYGDEAVLNWQNGENKNIQVTLKNQF